MPVQMTGSELEADDDSDVPVLARPQGYVGDQTALIAAITKELSSGGATTAGLNAALPIIETFAQAIIGVVAPPLAPIVATVIGALPKQI